MGKTERYRKKCGNGCYSLSRLLISFIALKRERESSRAAPVGTGAGGAVDFGVPQATVDEIVFDNSTVFQGIGGTAPPSHLAGGALLVGGGFGETAVRFTVLPNTARAALGGLARQMGRAAAAA